MSVIKVLGKSNSKFGFAGNGITLCFDFSTKYIKNEIFKKKILDFIQYNNLQIYLTKDSFAQSSSIVKNRNIKLFKKLRKINGFMTKFKSQLSDRLKI